MAICIRCKKKIEHPGLVNEMEDGNPTVKLLYNAEYIIAKDLVDTVIREGEPIEVQKTGIICLDCYQPTDIVIWGPHREENDDVSQ